MEKYVSLTEEGQGWSDGSPGFSLMEALCQPLPSDQACHCQGSQSGCGGGEQTFGSVGDNIGAQSLQECCEKVVWEAKPGLRLCCTSTYPSTISSILGTWLYQY